MTAILRGFSRKLLAQTRGVIQTNRVPRARHNSGVKGKSCAVPGGLESLSHATHGSTTPTRATPARVGGPGETVGHHLSRPRRSGCARLPNIPSPTTWDERA